ncbi:MAG TPA: RNA polymerase sigma factor [Saprospiraceae bacterium]|nr:RNA polymerase sigma factor [Saprospiraceae bacterium]
MNIEKQLIAQCIQGDRKAQLRLYDQCYSYMMSICIRYCKDKHEAGSRLNMSFLKVLQHLGQFDHSGSFKAWVSKITLRSIIDEFRSQQKHYQQHVYYGQLSQEMDWPSEDVNHLAEETDLDHLLAVINRLSPMDKQVFNLFAIDGYGHKEIANMLNISEGTSKWHVHEARKKIKEALIKESKTTSLK